MTPDTSNDDPKLAKQPGYANRLTLRTLMEKAWFKHLVQVGLILLLLLGLKDILIPSEIYFVLSLLIAIIAYLNYKLIFFKGKQVSLSGIIVIVAAVAVLIGFVRFSRESQAVYYYQGQMWVFKPEIGKPHLEYWDSMEPLLMRLSEQYRQPTGKLVAGYRIDGVSVSFRPYKTEDGITPGLVFRVTGKGVSHQKQREKMEALMNVIETQLPEIEFAEKRIWLDTADGSRELTKHNSVEPDLAE